MPATTIGITTYWYMLKTVSAMFILFGAWGCSLPVVYALDMFIKSQEWTTFLSMCQEQPVVNTRRSCGA